MYLLNIMKTGFILADANSVFIYNSSTNCCYTSRQLFVVYPNPETVHNQRMFVGKHLLNCTLIHLCLFYTSHINSVCCHTRIANCVCYKPHKLCLFLPLANCVFTFHKLFVIPLTKWFYIILLHTVLRPTLVI